MRSKKLVDNGCMIWFKMGCARDFNKNPAALKEAMPKKNSFRQREGGLPK
jgi:hypothetical protein